MVKSKIITFTLSGFLSISMISIYYVIKDGENAMAFFGMAYVISLFAVPSILLYALPVTILIEKLLNGLSSKIRIVTSLLFHIIFGAAFVFIIGAVFESKLLFTDFKQFWLGYEIIFFAALVMAVIFWIIGEGVRNCSWSVRKKIN